VPPDYWASTPIERFASRRITTGCGADDVGRRLFCPDRNVTRAEMAVFLSRALGHTAPPTRTPPTFADVPADYWAYDFIEQFAQLGITTGCGTDNSGRQLYCPDRNVTRAEMARGPVLPHPGLPLSSTLAVRRRQAGWPSASGGVLLCWARSRSGPYPRLSPGS
jgi:hypothetical protein